MSRRTALFATICALVILSTIPGVALAGSSSPLVGSDTPDTLSDSVQVANASTIIADNATQQNSSQTSKQIPLPSPSPKLSASEQSEPAGGAVSPSLDHSERVTTNAKFDRNNSTGDHPVVYNGTDTWIQRSTDSEDRTRSNANTPNRSRLSQPAVPPSRLRDQTTNSGIIGGDDRVSVAETYEIDRYPWSSIVQLRLVTDSGQRTTCSGAIISENDGKPSAHVLTAGHCVYSENRGGWVNVTGETASYAVPAANEGQEPFGRVGIQNIRSYSGWVSDENPAYDIALITLDERIGHKTGSLGYVGIDTTPDRIYMHTPTRVTGYPGDKDRYSMWTSTGSGRGTYSYATTNATPEDVVHRYAIDTASGMSGGPVWIEDHPAYNERRVASVHAYAVDTDWDGETELTQGTRITKDRFTDFQSWMAEASVGTPENDRFEPNDYFESATPVSPNKTLTDLHIVNGEFDIFALQLSSGDHLRANSSFDHQHGNLEMALYGPDHEPISASQSETSNEALLYNVSQNGTYYVGVYGHDDDSGPYSLSLSVSQHPPSDNRTTVPANWELTDKQYAAIYENGDRPSTQEISAKLNEWFNSDDKTVGDTPFNTQEMSAVLNYWFNNH